MKLDAFLFLQRSDVIHHAAAGNDLGAIPHVFIDPGLAEEALRRGMNPEHFSYRPLDVGPHFQSRACAEAATVAASIDQALTRERRRLFGAGTLQGWDQEPMRLFLIRAFVARALGEICDAAFPEAAIGLYRPRNPQIFYFDSFLAADAFAGTSPRWQVAQEYDGAALWQPDHAAWCFDVDGIARQARAGAAEALTHIPTCYGANGRFQAQIAQRFTRNIDLPSLFWDIPVRRTDTLLRRIDELPAGAVSARALRYRDIAGRVFEQHLAPLLSSREALQAQCNSLAARAFMQAINYEGLRGALRGTRPHFVLCDHDTGNNGPLFSVAAELGAPITVLPHSGHPASALPHNLGVRALEREGFRTPLRTVYGEAVNTVGARLGPTPTLRPRREVRTVCLLLNTLNSQGLSYVDLAAAARFHLALRALCERHGAELLLRLKPNGPGLLLATSAFDVPMERLQAVLDLSIEELARRSDLCIGYGEPTTGGIEFLADGCHVVQAGPQHWPASFTTSRAYLDDGSVPNLQHDEALAHVAALLAPGGFGPAAEAQRERFAQRLEATDDRLFPSP